jgi:hypothetical protein
MSENHQNKFEIEMGSINMEGRWRGFVIVDQMKFLVLI